MKILTRAWWNAEVGGGEAAPPQPVEPDPWAEWQAEAQRRARRKPSAFSISVTGAAAKFASKLRARRPRFQHPRRRRYQRRGRYILSARQRTLVMLILLGAAAAFVQFVVSPRPPPGADRSWASWRSIGSSGDFGPCRWIFRQNCVVDGDTIRYAGQKIRLADIDAPEISSPQCASEAALGQRAKQRLVALINAGPFEVVPAGGHDIDRYGRQLRIIRRDGRSLGDILVAEGLARRWSGARRSWCG